MGRDWRGLSDLITIGAGLGVQRLHRFLSLALCVPSCPLSSRAFDPRKRMKIGFSTLWLRFGSGIYQSTKRNGLPLRSCQPFCCISDVPRFSNHSHSRSSSSTRDTSFAALCLTRVHVFGTSPGQLTAYPTQIYHSLSRGALLGLMHSIL